MAMRVSRVLSQVPSLARRFCAVPDAIPASGRRFSAAAAVDEDDLVKTAFVKQQHLFRDYIQELGKINIPLDPNNQKDVEEYAANLQTIGKKLGVLSFQEKLDDLLEAAAEDTDSVRQFMETSVKIRDELGIDDSLGIQKAMFEALDDAEKKMGATLTYADADGMKTWQDTVDKINAKFDLSEADGESLEKQFEFDLAQAEVADYHAEAMEKIDTYKRRDGLDTLNIQPKDLDPRPYL